MGKAGLVLVVLLLTYPGRAVAQTLPDPLPENNPKAWLVGDQNYPSARMCGKCHPNQYKEWSVSSHAYASVSPMFNKFEQAINNFASGTVNYFCVRCHASVGTSLGELRSIAWWDRAPAAKEGITCVTCHRAGEAYGKSNGARRITPGSIHEAVFGPFDTRGGIKAISGARQYGILVDPDEPDRPPDPDGKEWIRIHQTAIQSDVLKQAEFCVPCHQVAVYAGIKLETVWEEYRASPAAKKNITCQQCHMSTYPGQNVGFDTGWAAKVNGNIMRSDRPLTDHTFVGPGYPISHPGLFPFGLEESPFDAQRWLKFDYRAKWGSDDFENTVAASPGAATFPPEWQNAADRKQAWQIVQENYARWKERGEKRKLLMAKAARLEGPFFKGRAAPGQDLEFSYEITNLNEGHNLPSGSLGAQPELWLNVALIDPDGERVWESGYMDKYGDVADFQALGVQEGDTPLDHQLFNMQAKFITTNVKGTDREMYLPVQFDVDQRPLIRPGGAPNSVLNHPPFVRMEKRSIPPLATREAKYHVPGEKLKKPGKYKLAVRIRGRTEPIYFMRFVGATNDMLRSENEWADDSHASATEFELGSGTPAPRLLGELEHLEAPPNGWFGPQPTIYNGPYDAEAQLGIYRKSEIKTPKPPVELGIRLYDRGAYEPTPTLMGKKNPMKPAFMVFGDLRVAAAYNDGLAPKNGKTDQSQLAARLNMDAELQLTATERFHAVLTPLTKAANVGTNNAAFTSYLISGQVDDEFEDALNLDLNALFFEGDAGAIAQGVTGRINKLDLPFTFGRIPIFTQNGIWTNDAIDGAAVSITAKHNAALDISNYDFTFFVGLDNVTTAALKPGDDGKVFGVATFADFLRGYFEAGYAYLDADPSDLSYHNVTAAFSRRYRGKVSNSVRVIGNFGQDTPSTQKTADGWLLLIENSLITRNPQLLIPYVNLFAGFDTPQSLMRAAGTGGVLLNTGINFETDGMTNFPTLNATARDSWGGAVGVEYLFSFNRQIIVEAAVVRAMEDATVDQHAIGIRYQQPIRTTPWIIRADVMHGWQEKGDDLTGIRIELRRKF